MIDKLMEDNQALQAALRRGHWRSAIRNHSSSPSGRQRNGILCVKRGIDSKDCKYKSIAFH